MCSTSIVMMLYVNICLSILILWIPSLNLPCLCPNLQYFIVELWTENHCRCNYLRRDHIWVGWISNPSRLVSFLKGKLYKRATHICEKWASVKSKKWTNCQLTKGEQEKDIELISISYYHQRDHYHPANILVPKIQTPQPKVCISLEILSMALQLQQLPKN